MDAERQTWVRKQTAVDAKTAESVFSRLQRLTAFGLALPFPRLSPLPAHMPLASLCMLPRGPCPQGPSSHLLSSCWGMEILASLTGSVNSLFQGSSQIFERWGSRQ